MRDLGRLVNFHLHYYQDIRSSSMPLLIDYTEKKSHSFAGRVSAALARELEPFWQDISASGAKTSLGDIGPGYYEG